MESVLLTSDASSVDGILTLVTNLVEKLVDWMGKYLDFIVQRPILFIGLIIMMAGLGIGMLGRLFHLT